MSTKPLHAHSLTEAYFYLMLVPCPACRSGPLKEERVTVLDEHIDTTLQLECRCTRCATPLVLQFVTDARCSKTSDPPVVNPSRQPSKIIDVTQWLTLFHRIISEADKAADKPQARRLAFEAGLCLEEALKFFEPDNDLPPETAFFTAKHRDHAREHPTLFTRQKLVQMRSKLPDLTVPRRGTRAAQRGKWWRFWGRGDQSDD